jgi:cysteine desulfuration protein SufE
MDVDALFDRIHLAENLSPTRHVGIYAIVEKMKQQVS